MTLFDVSYGLLWIIALITTPMTVMILFQYARIQRYRDLRAKVAEQRLTLGGRLPSLSGTDLSSGERRDNHEWKGVFTVLALSPDCASCQSLMGELADAFSREQESFQEELSRLRVVCVGRPASCRNAFEKVRSIPLLQVDPEAAPALTSLGLPVAIAVDEFGTIDDVRNALSLNDILSLRATPSEPSVVSQRAASMANL